MGLPTERNEASHDATVGFSPQTPPSESSTSLQPSGPEEQTRLQATDLPSSSALLIPTGTNVVVREVFAEFFSVQADADEQPHTALPHKRTRTPFLRIYNHVRSIASQRREAGLWGLPTTSSLAAEIGCSRDSVAKAMQVLVAQGVVEFANNRNGYLLAGYREAGTSNAQIVSLPEREIWIEITPPEERGRRELEREARWQRGEQRRWRALFPRNPEPVYVQLPLPSQPPEYEQIPLKKPGALWQTIASVLQHEVEKGIITGAFPRQADLAERFNCSPSLVELAVQDLSAKGLIQLLTRKRGYVTSGTLSHEEGGGYNGEHLQQGTPMPIFERTQPHHFTAEITLSLLKKQNPELSDLTIDDFIQQLRKLDARGKLPARYRNLLETRNE